MRLAIASFVSLVLIACAPDTSRMDAALSVEPEPDVAVAATLDNVLSEGTAVIPADAASPFAQIDTFWASFQEALASGDRDRLLDYFHEPVTVDGVAYDRAAFQQSGAFDALAEPEMLANRTLRDVPVTALEGSGGAYSVIASWDVPRGATAPGSISVEIRTLQGYFAISRLAGGE